MSQRFRWALLAAEQYDLCELAKLLTGAVQETIAEGGMPHLDSAVRLICKQIAFAGNGDIAAIQLYEKMYLYCQVKAAQGQNFEFINGGDQAKAPESEPH